MKNLRDKTSKVGDNKCLLFARVFAGAKYSGLNGVPLQGKKIISQRGTFDFTNSILTLQ